MKLLRVLFSNINNKIKNNHNLKNLEKMVQEYNGSDWRNHVLFSKETYGRDIIYRNETMEMIIISWNNNQISGIHDHPKNGCLMKILQGELEEHIYNDNLETIDIKNRKKGSVGYIAGTSGLHNIVNKDNKTVSLHIYSPPNYISNKYCGK